MKSRHSFHRPFGPHLGNKAEGPLDLGWYKNTPNEKVSFIITQHGWVLLGVLTVKLILSVKVKNPTLLGGRNRGNIFTIRESKTLKQQQTNCVTEQS